MESHPRKVGIMVSAPPRNGEFSLGLESAVKLLEQGAQVYLYCIDAAVEGIDDPRFGILKDRGARIFACAYSLQQRGLTPKLDVTLSGLTVLSDIMASTDEFQSFN